MDVPPARSILLVGEGNFSFSSSVCQLEAESSITATCLQHQEEALRQEGAAINIQTIQDSGGCVLFGVDCTKLGECVSLQGRVFDRVVFNFPHCGRKSGVKKNRELLKNFFLSCIQVLAEDGEVHVSLCNGQGGTPADKPRREWHNSWQVAAMAAEAHLILSAVCPFENENYPSYKCTGYSFPYIPVQITHMEEVVEGENVHYNIPAELSDYVFRRFLSPDSVHPVKLVQDFFLKELLAHWSVSMATASAPFLIAAKQLHSCCHGVDNSQCYWIHLLQRDLTCPAERKDPNIQEASSASKAACNKENRMKSLWPACSSDVHPEVESGLYALRPTLLPQLNEFLAGKEAQLQGGRDVRSEGEKNKNDEGCNGAISSFFGISGVVFRNIAISLWALPAFHQLLLRGVFPSDTEPIKLLRSRLEKLLSPYRVSVATEERSLQLTVEPLGLVGEVFQSSVADSCHVTITVSLNLDLLAVLLFSLPDWRLLWSHEPRFIRQFSHGPPPGTPFCPFSLHPEPFSFDISFWTGPSWEEKKFYAAIREASLGTVEQVQLMDTFSHPDLSQTSYCYRLTYHSHTHALSHTQALMFHKHLELLLSSRLQVTIR